MKKKSAINFKNKLWEWEKYRNGKVGILRKELWDKIYQSLNIKENK